VARIRPSEGNGKSGSLCDVQSVFRTHLAGIEETVVANEPANLGLRSQYSIRLYSWAKKYASVGRKRISLEDLRKVLGLESVKDEEGNVIQEPPLPVWANFRPAGVGCWDHGDHQEDGPEDRNRVAGTIKVPAGSLGDFFD
jgi:hypothetical protein